MKRIAMIVSTLVLVGALTVIPAGAQATGGSSSSPFNLRPQLTSSEFETFTADVGSMLRFRQLGDPATLPKGQVDLGVQYASTSFDDPVSFPQVAARFGVSDRVDVGAWGGVNLDSEYGIAGVDTKIALLRQSNGRPVSVSIRPSLTSLIGPSEVWIGTASIDLSVSRAFGTMSPYAGVATSTSLGVERSDDVDFDPATPDESLAYAGLAFRWRTVSLAAEVQKGNDVSYAFRIGTRF